MNEVQVFIADKMLAAFLMENSLDTTETIVMVSNKASDPQENSFHSK